ncbi:SNF2 family N-terminal domain-domain-containing protein [Leucosporidium creatinivorum]|uniref:SNF2 family N-terminal domain-domain-containing protein n=1 Tax=Leucosporidium creatinivorum TaxID=106004 RepID=A0A1Y2FVK2_9BASI|nr:SNF2 family N-terminal domain-domain-containing protein [Leucosporidium creatinivorum]
MVGKPTHDGYASDSSDSSIEYLDETEWRARKESTRATSFSEELPKPSLAVARAKVNSKQLGVAGRSNQEQKTTSAKRKARDSELEHSSPDQQSSRKRRKVDGTATPTTVDEWLERVEEYASTTEEAFTADELSMLPVEGNTSSYLVKSGILKPFQLDGVKWIMARHTSVSGCLLADEMGTGKTIQSIAFIAFVRQNAMMGDRARGIPSFMHGANLIVCPLAVLRNWEAEFAKWAPNLKVVVYHGSPEERKKIIAELDKLFDPRYEHLRPTIITNFEMATKDDLFVKRTQGPNAAYHFQVFIVDEAQRIKNSESKSHIALQQIRAGFRLLLTGTPIQNNLDELQALLSFTLPDVFGNRSLFQRSFDFSSLTSTTGSAALSDSEKKGILVGRLRRILEPFMLRRLKTDVQKDLPLKKEYVLCAPMTERQRELYVAVRDGALRDLLLREQDLPTLVKAPVVVNSSEAPIGERLQSRKVKSTLSNYIDLTEDDDFDLPPEKDAETKKKEAADLARATKLQRGRSTIMRQKHGSPIMPLRQIAFHPWLADPSGHPVPPGLEEDDDHPSWAQYKREVVKQSGKLQLLDRLLTKITSSSSSKVLIFSQFTMALDLVAEWLRVCKRWAYYQVDGGGNPVDQEELDDFNTNKSRTAARLFLISTRAGGVGITLTGADTVILLDSDFNPQNDLQAMDRAHRIGQTKPVLVFRLETEGSIDSLIIERATSKRRLDALVLGKDQTTSSARDLFNPQKKSTKPRAKFNLEALAQRLSALESERVDFAPGGKIISDEQLEQILDRSDAAMRGEKIFRARTNTSKGKGKATATKTKSVVSAVETIVLDEDSDEEDEVDRLFRV